MPLSAFERFTRKIDTSGDCWKWTGCVIRTGYGAVWASSERRTAGAHRVAYELFVGPIPKGRQLDHLCRNPRCVRPDHLEPVTPRENTLRGTSFAAENARKTHCHRGHEYTPENTYLYKRNGRWRDCRACMRAHRFAYRLKNGLVASFTRAEHAARTTEPRP